VYELRLFRSFLSFGCLDICLVFFPASRTTKKQDDDDGTSAMHTHDAALTPRGSAMQAVRTRSKVSQSKTKGDPTARDDWNPYDAVGPVFIGLFYRYVFRACSRAKNSTFVFVSNCSLNVS